MLPNKSKKEHESVMVKEFLDHFEGQSISVFFDGTLGAGGHARAILEAHPEIELLIGCDRDPEAIEIARSHLQPWANKVEFFQGSFDDLDKYLSKRGVTQVDGFFLIWGCHLCN